MDDAKGLDENGYIADPYANVKGSAGRASVFSDGHAELSKKVKQDKVAEIKASNQAKADKPVQAAEPIKDDGLGIYSLSNLDKVFGLPDASQVSYKPGVHQATADEQSRIDEAGLKDYSNVTAAHGALGTEISTPISDAETQTLNDAMSRTNDPAAKALISEQLKRPKNVRGKPSLGLSDLSTMARNFEPSAMDSNPDSIGNDNQAADGTFGNAVIGLGQATSQGMDAARQGVRSQFADIIGSDDMKADAKRKYQQIQGDIERSTPQFDSPLFNSAYSGLSSFMQNAPALAAGVATGSAIPALAAAGVQTEAQAYAKYRERGATGVEAAIGALGEGSLEVLTEFMPMSAVVEKFGKVKTLDLLKDFFKKEVAGEEVATLSQDAVDTAIANPDKTWGDYLRERPQAAFDTLIATVIMAGAVSGASHVARKFKNETYLPDPYETADKAKDDAINKWNTEGLAPSTAKKPKLSRSDLVDMIMAPHDEEARARAEQKHEEIANFNETNPSPIGDTASNNDMDAEIIAEMQAKYPDLAFPDVSTQEQPNVSSQNESAASQEPTGNGRPVINPAAGSTGAEFSGNQPTMGTSADDLRANDTSDTTVSTRSDNSLIDLLPPDEMSRAQDVVSQDGLILQNRDRSSPSSINQMQAIASNPDFLRAGISNDMQTGAPIVFGNDNALPSNIAVGDKDVTVDGKGNRYDTQYAVVDANDLITSHNVSGIPNDSYQSGAGGKMRVIAGNGRAAGIARGYEQQTAEQYKADLIQKANKVGIDPAAVESFKNPVLVRVMNEQHITNDIGDLSNISQTAQLSPVEQAKNDAQRLNIDSIEHDESGDLSVESIKRWIASLPDTEKTGLSSNGQISRQAIDRIHAAIFYKAYGSDELVRLYSEATDEEAKNVINALGVAAPLMIKLEGKDDMDIRGAAVEAAGIIINAKRSGKPIGEYLANVDALTSDEAVAIAEFFAANMRAKNKLAEAFKSWTDFVVKQSELADTNKLQGAMFGEVPVKSRKQLFEEIKNAKKSEQGQQQPNSSGNAENNASGQAAVERAADSGSAENSEQTENRESPRQEVAPTLDLVGQTNAEINSGIEATKKTAKQKIEQLKAERAAKIEAERKQRQELAAAGFELSPQAKTQEETQKAVEKQIDAQYAGQGDLLSDPAPEETEPPKNDEATKKAKSDLDDALGDLGEIFGRGFRSNITPEQEQKLIQVLTRLFDAAFRLGYHEFKAAAKFVLDTIRAKIGDDVADSVSIDHLQGSYIGMAGKYGDKASKKRDVVSVESLDELKDSKNVTNERSSTNLEPDSKNAAPANRLGKTSIQNESGSNGRVRESSIQESDQESGSPSSGELLGFETPTARERSNIEVYTGSPTVEVGTAGNSVDQRGGDSGITGAPIEPNAATAIDELAQGGLFPTISKIEQIKADKVKQEHSLENVRATLPILKAGQQEDVFKTEERFSQPEGYGMLFTNGTGTGKTFTGLGVIKRFANAGKENTLIVAPNDKIIEDWQNTGKLLGLKINRLDSTTDAGSGITITTYANMGSNKTLADRNWDLIVHDEAHYLAMDKNGTNTNALKTLRAITNHPQGMATRHEMLYRDDIAKLKLIQEQLEETIELGKSQSLTDKQAADNDALNDKLTDELDKAIALNRETNEKVRAQVKESQGAARTRTLFLSATPFAYEKTVDWANGYLFDYNEGQANDGSSGTAGRGYNSGSNLDRFMMQHFGYRMRYNKLTEPDAKVDRGLMQRQFNTWLKKNGVLSSRMLDVDADYDRKFVLIDSAIGTRIDQALQWFELQRKATEDKKRTAAIYAVQKLLSDKFDYLSRRYLLEAIKAKAVVAHVKEHMALGRKVVVFHDYKKGGGFNPFNMGYVTEGQTDSDADDVNQVIDEFKSDFSDLVNSPEFRSSSPITTFQTEFPNVLLFNGDVPSKVRRENVAKFNNDNTGAQVILVQSAAGKEGISLHDTTGKHQRVLFNLGQPTQPTTSIQQEGRIYRTGQVTDAIFRYLNTGTNWERWAFATTIAQRASAAENLAMGEQARALKDAFITGFEESGDYRAGMEGEGKGGKERDRAANEALTEFDRAKAFYYGTQKKTAKTKAQEGNDYFATPEPVGLKMVQFADIRAGEKSLEPSAGHGAIARWLPENSERTAIEPSMALRPRLAMVYGGNILGHDFEDLNIINKYDAIVMNPPFGSAGRTAVDHVAKAARHLNDGGRIVALIPVGATDQKFDKWFYEESERDVKPLVDDPTLGKLYKGDTIESRLSWAATGKLIRASNDMLLVKIEGTNGEVGVNPTSVTNVKATGKRKETYRPADGLYLAADIKLPSVTFERAGTAVNTRIVVIEKASAENAPQQVKRDYTGISDINDLFDRIEDLELKPRAKPLTDDQLPATAETKSESTRQKDIEARERDAKAAESGAIAKSGQNVTFEIKGDKLITNAPAEKVTTNKGKELEGVFITDPSISIANAREADRFAYYPKGKAAGIFVRLRNVERPGDEEVSFSRSPMKSVDANVTHGEKSMNQALITKADVKRAMYHNELGWIDFVWGDEFKGIQHIIKQRMAKDGMSVNDIYKLLTKDLIDTIASGKVIRQSQINNNQQIVVAKGDYEAILVKNKGNNGWLLTGWKLKQSDAIKAGNDTKKATQLRADSTDSKLGAEAVKELSTIASENVNPLFSRAPIFYSALTRAVDGVKLNKAPADAWKNLIKNLTQKGVKQDEIEWSGVSDWLDLQQGQVTKAQVLDYLNNNGVQVDETILGDALFNAETYSPKDFDSMPTDLQDLVMQVDDGEIDEDQFVEEAESLGYKVNLDMGGSVSTITKGENKYKPTKYKDYTVAGGNNYKELLLTLPERHEPVLTYQVIGYQPKDGFKTREEAQQYIDESLQATETMKQRAIELNDEILIKAFERFADDQNRFPLSINQYEAKESRDSNNDYTSGHFTQKNILAHVRFDERTDAEGNKVLFINEIQSDWGQAGKKTGFNTNPKAKARYDELRKKWLNNSLSELEGVEFDQLSEQGARRIGDIPTAPFVTKTDAWVSLAMKRMIRYAAENGFDKVALINGQQAADLYDLSKQVDKIKWTITNPARLNNGVNVYDLNPIANGVGMQAQDERFSNIPENKLEDIVGKDVAKKIIESSTNSRVGTIEADDLKVGGEGMRVFYDQIVPKVAKDVLKKLGGGKVELQDVDSGKLLEDADGNSSLIGLVQNTITITPEMRDQVMQGLPLFSRNDPFFSLGTGTKLQLTKSKSQFGAKVLNKALVKYFDSNWSDSFESVDVPDTLLEYKQEIKAAFGKELRYVSPTKPDFDIFAGVQLRNSPSAIYVNARAETNLTTIAGHELYHSLERTRPDLHEWFKEQAEQYIQNFGAYHENLNKKLKDGEKPYKTETALSELLADFTGDALSDTKFLQELANADGNKFKGLLNATIRFLNQAITKLQNLGSSRYISDVEALRNSLRKALVAFSNGEQISSDNGSDVAFNRNNDVNILVTAWQKLASNRRLFQLIKSDSKDMNQVFDDIAAGLVEIETESADKGAIEQWKVYPIDSGERVEDKNGTIRLYDDGKVEIDVANWGRYKGGSAIYAAVSNWAYNNGKVFTGDRQGISPDGMMRRLENMISTTLKFGTTDHIQPHPNMLGELEFKWKEGDTEYNLDQMLNASYNAIKNGVFVTENEGTDFEVTYKSNNAIGVAKIDDLFYDTNDGTFKNRADGTEFTDAEFAKLAKTYGARNVDAGSATLKRAVITSTSLRATAQGERGRFLGGIIRLARRDNGLNQATAIAYSRTLPDTITIDSKKRPTLNSNGKPIQNAVNNANLSNMRLNITDNGKYLKSVPIHAIESSGDKSIYIDDNGNVQLLTQLKFKSISDLQREAELLLQEYFSPLKENQFVRVSTSKDDYEHLINGTHRGSKNWATGMSEGGLSVAKIPQPVDGGEYAYIVEGEKVGNGSDGEPLLDLNTVKPITKPIEINNFKEDYQKALIENLKSLGIDEGDYRVLVTGGKVTKEEIPSAIGNTGSFDSNNDSILFSRKSIVGNSGRQYTPEQKAALERTGSVLSKNTVKETLQEIWQDAGKKAAQGIFDQFAPVKDIDSHAYTLLRLSKGATGAFEAFMHYGKLKISNDVTDADNTGGVLDKVFYPLGKESTDFLRWIAGNRAERLAREGKENLFTKDDITAFKSLTDGQTDFDYTLANGNVTRERPLIYLDSLAKFNGFSRNVLDIAEQSGLIDPASRKHWEHDFYVPFYRMAEDQEGGVRGLNIKGGVIRQEAFKKLKGGDQKLNDLLSNTLMNWAHLIDASAKNRAALATLKTAEQLGLAHKAVMGDKKTVWAMEGGNKVEYKVDDPYILTAISSLEYAGMRNGAMGILSMSKNLLTVGVTASPFFKVRNLIRDSVQAIATAELSYNPVKNIKEGIALTNKKNPVQEYISALAGGGLIRFGTMLEGNDASRVRQLIKQGASDESILNDESKVRKMYDKYIDPSIAAYNELGNRGEEINRMALYHQLKAKGMDHATASLMARDLMDFSMHGAWTSVRFLTQVVPFMNARLQGLYKLGKSANEDKARFAIVLGAVTVASLALLAAYGDDDDWKKREDWDRDNYWWFKIGGTAFRIPKPFEIGAIATIAERGAELVFDKEMTGDRFKKVIANLVMNQLSMNPTPQLVKPIIDIYANKDSFTGRPIEGMGMERLDPDYRFNQDTSLIARGVSTAGNAVTGNAFLSPIQIDHLVQSYFGWIGSFVVSGSDILVRSTMNEPTKPALDLYKAATGGMVAKLPSDQSRYVTQMYDQAAELEKAYSTWKHLQKQGKGAEAESYRQSHDSELKVYRNVETVKKLTKRINDNIKKIELADMSASEKQAKISNLRQQQDQIARRLTPQ